METTAKESNCNVDVLETSRGSQGAVEPYVSVLSVRPYVSVSSVKPYVSVLSEG